MVQIATSHQPLATSNRGAAAIPCLSFFNLSEDPVITVQIKNQTGRIDAPYVALLTVETFALPASVSDGTTVALLTPEGDTLAIGHASGGQVTLDSNTLQAAGYCHGVPVGESKNAFLVIGETDSLQAIIPVLVRANPLDDLAPPAQMAPAYPTTAELQAILKEMTEQASAASKAADSVAKDAQRVDNLVNVQLPKAVEEIDAHLDTRVRAAERVIERAAVDASTTLSAAASEAATALDGKVSAASTALDGKVSTASTAISAQVTAATNAATAADGSAKAAQKALDDAEAAKGNAAESAKNAATSAEQAEQAKTAIGDVVGRLDAVETSVERKASKISNYLRGMFDYTFVETKYPYWMYFAPCHDGWMFNENYGSKPRFHVSSTGKVTQIMTGHSSVTRRLLIADTNNKTTRFYETLSGKHYLTTIGGVGDGVTISRVEIAAFPNEAIGAYTGVYGIVLKNGFIVCTNGHILDSNLDYFGSINCSATARPFTQVLRVGDNAVRYFDTSSNKQTKLTIADDGTLSFETCYYTYSAQSNENYYMFNSRYRHEALLINANAIKVSNGNNGNFYKYGNEWLPIVWRGSSRFGFIFNGQDLFYVYYSANGNSQSVVQHTFNLVDTFERREVGAGLYEDATGNFIVTELVATIYAEGTGYLHVFRYKEA